MSPPAAKTKGARETPMMRQYLRLKRNYPDAFLFYRMGDFYEMFLEDAQRAAPLLEIALTTRDKGKPDSIPMCGVPVHSADGYIKKLAALGHRVAVCEQVAAEGAANKKLFARKVVEVITPGLTGDPAGLPSAREVALAALWPAAEEVGLAALDVSTGNFRATRAARAACKNAAAAAKGAALPPALLDELERIAPREVLLPEGAPAQALQAHLQKRLSGAAFTALPARSFSPAAAPAAPAGFNPEGRDAALAAAAAVLCYVAQQQPAALQQAPRLLHYALGDSMILDGATRRHLELFENQEDRGRGRTLIERIDESVTPLGARRLANWLAYPLCSPEQIMRRQNAVAYLAARDRTRARLRRALQPVRDLERLHARCSRPGAEPRDLTALRASLEALPHAATALRQDGEVEEPLAAAADAPALPPELQPPRPLPEAAALLRAALVDEPKALPRGSRGAGESGYIRPGFNAELDKIHRGAREGREWIAQLEARERKRSGIETLKVRFHPVHGYSLEISKQKLARAPKDYQRKQTLASVERFTTPDLLRVEQQVLGANERAAALERKLFEQVRQQVLQHAGAMREAAAAVARLDALQALAECARQGAWVRPQVDAGLQLHIDAGRHPVIESVLQREGEDFVANDTALSPEGARLLLITGPNMAGKSTYLRQTAVLVLLAQIGSFVPAAAARIGVVDRIFTRVGASDRLTQGESTFMVEMRETAEILAQATNRSLVVLDEIGRGTSTFDGLSIAWAVAEHLLEAPGLGARTLFATHYHELAELARVFSGAQNAHFTAREWGEEIIFLRQLLPGEASRSYGIQVARLAGLPKAVIARARQVLHGLETGETPAVESAAAALPLFANAGKKAAAPALEIDPALMEIASELREAEPEKTTPLQALELLTRWAARVQANEGESGA